MTKIKRVKTVIKTNKENKPIATATTTVIAELIANVVMIATAMTTATTTALAELIANVVMIATATTTATTTVIAELIATVHLIVLATLMENVVMNLVVATILKTNVKKNANVVAVKT